MKFLFFLLLFNISLTSFSQEKKIDVTYIANEGFMFETNNQQLAIDALFKDVYHDYLAPHDSIVTKIIKGQKPFDELHMLLVTHIDADHFNDSIVVEYLNYNPINILIAPFLVVNAILSHQNYKGNKNQIIGLYKNSQYKIDTIIQGIRIQSFALQHDNRPEFENVGYLIDLNGIRIFHTGDCTGADTMQFETLKLQTKNIDLSLLNFYGFVRTHKQCDFTKDKINPKEIVLMHIPPKEVEPVKECIKKMNSNFINITVFNKSMEKISFKFNHKLINK